MLQIKTFSKLTGIFLFISLAIVSVIMIKAEPTASDEKILSMIKSQNDTINISLIDENVENNETITSSQTNLNENIKDTEDKTECTHTSTFEKEISKATCIKEGEKHLICNDCEQIINKSKIDTQLHNTTTITTNASCLQDGTIKTICKNCNKILDTKIIPQQSHVLDIIENIPETPFDDGLIVHQCKKCKTKFQTIVKFVPQGEVNLYIPSVDINCEVILAECNQTNTDKYDVSCDMYLINNNNPVFFGHNTRTFKNLYKTKVNDLIYFTINNKTHIYKIIVSEEGNLIDGGTNIKGKETGSLCIKAFDENTLHFFTCYSTPWNYNSRWIVLAEKIQ